MVDEFLLPENPTPMQYSHVSTVIHEAGHAKYVLSIGGAVSDAWIDHHGTPETHHGETAWQVPHNPSADELVMIALSGKAIEVAWILRTAPRVKMDRRLLDSPKGPLNTMSQGDWDLYRKWVDESSFTGDPIDDLARIEKWAEANWDAILKIAKHRIDERCDCMKSRQKAAPAATKPAAGAAAATTGGSSVMSDIEMTRAHIAAGNDKAEQAVSCLNTAMMLMEESRGFLMAATQGTNRQEVQDAIAAVAETLLRVEEAKGPLANCVVTTRDYAATL